ncbi:MAG: type VI secretion system tube protein Hcp [Motiliproteus sp.]
MAMDMFIEIDGIKGECVLDKSTDAIDVLAWSWGLNQSGTMHTGTGGGGGRVDVQDISYTQWLEKSAPRLMQACSKGEELKEARLIMRKAGGKEPIDYLVITMKPVLISSVSTGGSGGEDRLTMNVTLNFAEVKVSYQQQKSDGSKEGGPIDYQWDIAKNKE